MGDVQVIRYLHYGQGWAKKRIARELRVDIKTVRRVLAEKGTGEYRLTEPRARPVSGPIEAPIRQLLAAEVRNRAPRKQRLTAARIEDILRKEDAFAGGEASVRRAVGRVRRGMGDPLVGAFVPLEYEPGVDCQVDFLEGDVDYPNGRQRRHFLLMRACYSTRPFVYHAPDESQEALFDGLVQGFEHFGGVFHHVWFDNLTAAVARVLRSRARQVQVRFAALAAHYGFMAEFCGVGLGNEKGGVENGVQYVQQRFLSPVPAVGSDEELTAWTRVWMAEQDGRRPVGRPSTIGRLWAEEVAALMPLPTRRFDACRVATRRVSGYSLVQDGTNFYSVPAQLAGRTVILKRYAWTVELHDDTGLVATHKRLFGRGQVSFQLAHYLPLLERKVRAFDRAAPVRAVRATWPASYEILLRLLRARCGDANGTREFIHVLQLHEHHTIGHVHEAVRRSLTHAEPSLGVVRRELEQLTGANRPPAPLPATSTNHLPAVTVAVGTADAYGQLCHEVGR
jgi:transposase